MLSIFTTKDFNFSSPRDYILHSYVEDQAQVLASRVSLLRVRNPFLYDLIITIFS